MTTSEENRRLTEVGAGTPMGDLLRRYWHPIAATAELEERPDEGCPGDGQDLVLYRDENSTYGLLGRHCDSGARGSGETTSNAVAGNSFDPTGGKCEDY